MLFRYFIIPHIIPIIYPYRAITPHRQCPFIFLHFGGRSFLIKCLSLRVYLFAWPPVCLWCGRRMGRTVTASICNIYRIGLDRTSAREILYRQVRVCYGISSRNYKSLKFFFYQRFQHQSCLPYLHRQGHLHPYIPGDYVQESQLEKVFISSPSKTTRRTR